MTIFFRSAYFAVSLLGTVSELLDNPKHDKLQIVGCQTLTRFIYSQVCDPLESTDQNRKWMLETYRV